jgi:hypothetical protein
MDESKPLRGVEKLYCSFTHNLIVTAAKLGNTWNYWPD